MFLCHTSIPELPLDYIFYKSNQIHVLDTGECIKYSVHNWHGLKKLPIAHLQLNTIASLPTQHFPFPFNNYNIHMTAVPYNRKSDYGYYNFCTRKCTS